MRGQSLIPSSSGYQLATPGIPFLIIRIPVNNAGESSTIPWSYLVYRAVESSPAQQHVALAEIASILETPCQPRGTPKRNFGEWAAPSTQTRKRSSSFETDPMIDRSLATTLLSGRWDRHPYCRSGRLTFGVRFPWEALTPLPAGIRLARCGRIVALRSIDHRARAAGAGKSSPIGTARSDRSPPSRGGREKSRGFKRKSSIWLRGKKFSNDVSNKLRRPKISP